MNTTYDTIFAGIKRGILMYPTSLCYRELVQTVDANFANLTESCRQREAIAVHWPTSKKTLRPLQRPDPLVCATRVPRPHVRRRLVRRLAPLN